MRSAPHNRFTYGQLNEMAAIASQASGAADAGVAVTLVNETHRQAFAIWAVDASGLTLHELEAEFTSQDRLNAHVAGFVANQRALNEG